MAMLLLCLVLSFVIVNALGMEETNADIQVCNGRTPFTCVFHAWMHAESPKSYCVNEWKKCDVAVCPHERPYLCHPVGRCVDVFSKCSPCPQSTPFRCELDWSCRKNSSVCPQIPKHPNGALIKTTFSGVTGVLLDEVSNTTETRKRAAKYYLNIEDDFWQKKARYQGKLTGYKAVFRHYYYPTKRQLTLPPDNLWNFKIGKPYRQIIGGHDFVVANYSFVSYLLAPVSSIRASEPALLNIGGSFEDTWYLPVDESMLLQRTGYACMDEDEFPINSVDSENTWVYYDDTCEIESPTDPTRGCHFTAFPNKTCRSALLAVGRQAIKIRWERVAWDSKIANKYRYPKDLSTLRDHPDQIPAPRSLNDNRIYWRYFPEGSCETTAGENFCVRAPGWRRVLTFQSSSINNSKKDLIIGIPTFAPWNNTGLFVYAPCHRHYHFTHYANFFYGKVASKKSSFCVQSTWRWYNTEFTSLNSDFGSCVSQGTSAGWGDNYNSGLSCQWIDITESPEGTDLLVTAANPDGILCEGDINLNKTTGEYIFYKTNFTNVLGKTQYAPKCTQSPGANLNNNITLAVTVPKNGGTLVTSSCMNHEFGPKRNCGFSFLKNKMTCTPNSPVSLLVKAVSTVATVVRICDYSIVQKTGIPCEHSLALANSIVDGSDIRISFKCPGARDEVEIGGFFSVFGAPALESDSYTPPVISQ